MHKLCACAACESEDYDMTRFGKTKYNSWYIERVFFFSLFSGEQRRTRRGRRALETLEGTPASRSPSLAKKKKRKNNLVLQTSVVRQVFPKGGTEFGHARTQRLEGLVFLFCITWTCIRGRQKFCSLSLIHPTVPDLFRPFCLCSVHCSVQSSE